jgi:hypothetical protein
MPYLKNAGFVLAVFALAAFVQMNVMQLPVVGPYLPGGKPPTA